MIERRQAGASLPAWPGPMLHPVQGRLSRSVASTSAAIVLFASLSCDPEALSSGPADITVTFTGPASAAPALLLYSGRESVTCESFKSSVGTPTVTLNDVTYDATCRVEVDAFAPGFGAYGRAVDPADPSSDDWFLAAITSGSLDITMPDPTIVPLRIWIVAPATEIATAEGVRDRLLDKAFPVLDELGTGMTVDTASSTLAPASLTASCSSAGAISSNTAIYDATKVNVYFVSYYGSFPGLSPARNCWLQSHPEIVFISYGDPNVTDPTLVHELGHALGLVHPKIPQGGHAYVSDGYDAFNLMATNVDVTGATIGQLYAMNFSSDSWINRAGSPLAKPVVRTCQDNFGTGECPVLTVTQPGWPP